jgi:hypothetical protein
MNMLNSQELSRLQGGGRLRLRRGKWMPTSARGPRCPRVRASKSPGYSELCRLNGSKGLGGQAGSCATAPPAPLLSAQTPVHTDPTADHQALGE